MTFNKQTFAEKCWNILYAVLAFSLILTGCMTPEERRLHDKAELDQYLSHKPLQCGILIGNPRLRRLSCNFAILNGHFHEQLGFFRTAVDNHAIYNATIENIMNCQNELGKTQQEANQIVYKRMQENDEKLPESERLLPRFMAAYEASQHVKEATFYKDFAQFYSPFQFRLNSHSKLHYERYSSIWSTFNLVSKKECKELDKALHNALYNAFHYNSTLRSCSPELVEWIKGSLLFNPEELRQNVLQISPDEVSAILCMESQRLNALAEQFAKENRREWEEPILDKDGNEKIDKDGNVKTRTRVEYIQRPLPRGVREDLIALYIIETQLEFIEKTLDFAEKIENSKKDMDKQLDNL